MGAISGTMVCTFCVYKHVMRKKRNQIVLLICIYTKKIKEL